MGDAAAVQKAVKADKLCMRPISREKSSRYDIEILSLLSSHSRLSIVLKRGIELLLLHITALDFPVFIASSPHEILILYEYAILPACTKSHAPIGDVKAVGQCDGSIAGVLIIGKRQWCTRRHGHRIGRCQDMLLVCAASLESWVLKRAALMAIYKK